jgi:hypothetical protein
MQNRDVEREHVGVGLTTVVFYCYSCHLFVILLGELSSSGSITDFISFSDLFHDFFNIGRSIEFVTVHLSLRFFMNFY